MKRLLIVFAIIISSNVNAQKRNYIWCFGDSAGIDFNNLSSPTTFASCNDTRGSNCAIADTNGSLMFYASTTYYPLFSQGYAKCGAIYCKNHNVMLNGDTIVGFGSFNEVIIIPFPKNDSLYYVFFAGVLGAPFYGLYYCVVNMNANGGLGAVIVKNIQLQPFKQIDCLNAIKHGNGRDWWLSFRRYNNGIPNNEFHSYLITPAGITNYTVQNVGSMTTTAGGTTTFSKTGLVLVYSNWRSLIEKYDFDRCSGVISNPVTIQQENDSTFNTQIQSNAISPNEKVLYVSAGVDNDSSYLIQYNLDSTDIPATKDTIWFQPYPINAAGYFKLAPDDKIYFANCYVTWTSGGYPYDDSLYNMYNMNLSVINTPDSLGAACNFTPYSFYLGGKRTYWGMPNNPDYDMPPLAGSLCDSLYVSIKEPEEKIKVAELLISYIGGWQKLFVNARNIKGKNCSLQLFDVSGRQVYTSVKKTQPPYFTEDVDVAGLANGLYIVRLVTEKEILSEKFIKE